ncbi:MAG: F0F1 ATP synthase subunit alpha [Candidatus Omnitrophota bacterium]
MKKIDTGHLEKIIEEKIKKYRTKIETAKVGTVIETGDGIARIYGLDDAMAGELILFPNNVYGMVLNLEEDLVGAAIFGSDEVIKEGDEVRLTGEVTKVPVGKELIGRVINAIGEPLDGKGKIETKKTRPVENIAPGVVERQPVKEPLQTGIKAIDSMIPIGRGQRELIVGDRKTGKTTVCIDTILNQKDKNVICIYVAIGQKQSTVSQIIDTFKREGAMSYTIVITASASDPAPLQYIAPYAGCAIAEEIRDNGGHALIVYDDLSKHAQCYRQLSLLLRRPPGREAYPGDIFYIHSKLLERAAKYSDEKGGGSLTALPIVETQAGDISTYIPTNLISITDGQIYLESDAFNKGIRPAINVGLSVSRVGGNAQIKAMKQVAGRLRMDLAQYREKESFAQFGTELDKATIEQLERGRRMIEVLKQDQQSPMPVEEQIAIIFAGVNGFLDDVPIEDINRFESEFISFLRKENTALLKKIKDEKAISEALKQDLTNIVQEFKKKFITLI